MPYFKIKTAYNEFLEIEGLNDLEKAQFAFLTDGKVMFSNGRVCRGKDIMGITEDWHREMGWNSTHEIEDDDMNELKAKGVIKKYTGVIAKAKIKVQYLIETRQTHLIGKDFKMPSMENAIKKIDTSELTKGLTV